MGILGPHHRWGYREYESGPVTKHQAPRFCTTVRPLRVRFLRGSWQTPNLSVCICSGLFNRPSSWCPDSRPVGGSPTAPKARLCLTAQLPDWTWRALPRLCCLWRLATAVIRVTTIDAACVSWVSGGVRNPSRGSHGKATIQHAFVPPGSVQGRRANRACPYLPALGRPLGIGRRSPRNTTHASSGVRHRRARACCAWVKARRRWRWLYWYPTGAWLACPIN